MKPEEYFFPQDYIDSEGKRTRAGGITKVEMLAMLLLCVGMANPRDFETVVRGAENLKGFTGDKADKVFAVIAKRFFDKLEINLTELSK